MCVVSFVCDAHKLPGEWPWTPGEPPAPSKEVPEVFRQHWHDTVRDKKVADLEERVKALETIIADAKKFDAETGQPDCELEEKMQLLRDLAKRLGVELAI